MTFALAGTDGRRYLYQSLSCFQGSIKLIGWDAFLGESQARNQAFIDRSGISDKSYSSLDRTPAGKPAPRSMAQG
ncbi:MAG: hypothetical protein ACR2O7_07935 [Parasphingorhabdus sp.]